MKFSRSVVLQVLLAILFFAQMIWLGLAWEESSYNRWAISVAFLTTLASVAIGWYFSTDTAGFERAISYIRGLIDGSKKVGLDSIQSIRSASFEKQSFNSALNSMSTGFKFMGIAGTKWLNKAFEEHQRASDILRNNRDHARVRMIFFDPESSELDRFATDNLWHTRVIEDVNSTLKYLYDLRVNHRMYFDVKIMRTIPPVRLHIFDHSHAFLSEYKANDSGWNTPQLVFTKLNDTEFPFLISLERVFDSFWDSTPSFDLEAWINARSPHRNPAQRWPYGVVHGRYQPFHSEHLEYVLRGIQRSEKICYVAVTNPDRRASSEVSESPHRHEPESNPYTFNDRAEMIIRSLKFCRTVVKSAEDLGHHTYALTLDDVDAQGKRCDRELQLKIIQFDVLDPESWRGVVPEDPDTVTFFVRQFGSWEERKAAMFRKHGYKVDLLDTDCRKRVTGTLVRELIRTGNEWRSFVPAGTVEVISEKQKRTGRAI